MPGEIYRELAKRIENDFIIGKSDPRLPSIRVLAQHYGVAYRTAWAALKHRASVATTPGSGTPTSGSSPAPARRSGDAARGLAERIAQAINSGDFRAAEPLPKFDYFVLTYHVTHKTVARAFVLLCRQKMVHKKGKRWLAGPPGAPGMHRGAEDTSPVTLWVLPDHHSWYFFFNDELLAPFVSSFRSETTQRGIRSAIVLCNRPTDATPYMPCGIDEARSLVKHLGSRYLGSVIHALAIEPEIYTRWINVLSVGGSRPVVFLDSANMNPGYTRTGLNLHKSYYRCFLDEPTAVRLALEHLAGFGHRLVGLPIIKEGKHSWTPNRYDLASRIGASLPGMRLVCAEHREPFWHQPDPITSRPSVWTFTREMTRFASGSARPSARYTQKQLVDRTGSMKELLDNGVTAIVSFNDRIAFEHYWWCRAAGIDIPHDLSQISFDNIPETDGMPITTIDFGFSRLGYLAAHALIGDIHVSAGRDGNLAGIPVLVDSGSVRPPR